MRRPIFKITKKQKLIIGLITPFALLLTLYFGWVIYNQINYSITKAKEKEDHYVWLQNAVIKLEKARQDLMYGGADDKWFEENAMDRTGQDKHLLQVADDLGLKHIRKTSLSYGETGENVHGTYTHEGYGAKDGYPIKISRGLSQDKERTVLAHEYIHYIYNNSYAYSKDQRLFMGLLNMYATNKGFQNRMRPYADENEMTIDELLAVSCTEIPDRDMDKYVLEWCQKWINRSKLNFAY